MKWKDRKKATVRERYEWEYRQDRVYNSYTDSEYNFEGLKGLREGYDSWVMKNSIGLTGWMDNGRRLYFVNLFYRKTGRVSASADIHDIPY